MEYQFCRIAIYMLLMAILTVRLSHSRELRPSQHGINNQDPPSPTGENSPETLTFFGGTAPNVPFPEARNMSGPSWRSSDGTGDGGRSRSGGGDRVRTVVLVASVACGISGVVLLAVAASIKLFRFQQKKKLSTNHAFTNTDDK
ncbi:hypothetical protein LguiB_033811 [Lonicera macranthoides]